MAMNRIELGQGSSLATGASFNISDLRVQSDTHPPPTFLISSFDVPSVMFHLEI